MFIWERTLAVGDKVESRRSWPRSVVALPLFHWGCWFPSLGLSFPTRKMGVYICIYIYMCIYIFFFFFQYWGLNSGSTPWATPPVLFCDGFFQDRVLLWTVILLISDSCVLGLQVWATSARLKWEY
jgi:hypothetical protein